LASDHQPSTEQLGDRVWEWVGMIGVALHTGVF
jgi:hypothetical protein